MLGIGKIAFTLMKAYSVEKQDARFKKFCHSRERKVVKLKEIFAGRNKTISTQVNRIIQVFIPACSFKDGREGLVEEGAWKLGFKDAKIRGEGSCPGKCLQVGSQNVMK